MNNTDIRTATANGVATIEIARPEKKNALTVAMYQAMADALNAAAADNAVRAVLITGQPGIFTAGNDLEDFLNRPRSGDGLDAPVFQFMRALAGIDRPVVAAVTGAAIGIGTTMLLHCDFVVVSDEARLAMPFTSLGLVPEFASSLLVPRRIGNAKAAEKLLLGEPMGPAEAVELGIANAVLPAAEVVPHARRIAERFNALPPGAVREAKRLLRRPDAEAIGHAIAAEAAAFGERLASAEAKEALNAFLAKRKPDFSKF
jgi:enoyl-CoA hydratase/carnithine racemase